jgi:hypothetical protein
VAKFELTSSVVKEMLLSFFTSTTVTHILLILHGVLCFYFFCETYFSVCLNKFTDTTKLFKSESDV